MSGDSSNGYLGEDPVFSPENRVALNRMRQIVKRQWVARFGPKLPYDEKEADKIIAAIAPETRENMIKAAVDGRLFS